jgi:membrane-associated phospholipid phosphatase
MMPEALVLAATRANGITATDRLTLGFLAGLAAVAALRHPAPAPLIAAIGVLGVTMLAFSRWEEHWPIGRMAHDFLPVAMVIGIFQLAGPLIAVANSTRWDDTLASLDRRVFGPLPELWFDALGRPWWLTDAASLAYVSYYVVPVAMGVALYRRAHRAAFHRLVFVVVASFLVSYACYFAMPATGPRVAPEAEDMVLGGSAISEAVRAFLRVAEINRLDAFPSGHTALSLVFVGVGWRLLPRWRLGLVAVAAGIIFATVYLSLHYVIDVAAGVLLALALPVVLPALERCVAPHPQSVVRRAAQRPSWNARQRPAAQPIRSNPPRR